MRWLTCVYYLYKRRSSKNTDDFNFCLYMFYLKHKNIFWNIFSVIENPRNFSIWIILLWIYFSGLLSVCGSFALVSEEILTASSSSTAFAIGSVQTMFKLSNKHVNLWSIGVPCFLKRELCWTAYNVSLLSWYQDAWKLDLLTKQDVFHLYALQARI